MRNSSIDVKFNEYIDYEEVIVINDDGKNLGVINIKEALKMAEEKETDLILISEKSKPPIVKFCRIDKYIFDKKQKNDQIRKNSKKIEMKEIKIGLNIDFGDLKTKIKSAENFLKDNKKIRFFMRFKRRQLPEAEKGMSVLQELVSKLQNVTIEKQLSMDGNVASLIIKPNHEKK